MISINYMIFEFQWQCMNVTLGIYGLNKFQNVILNNKTKRNTSHKKNYIKGIIMEYLLGGALNYTGRDDVTWV